MTYFLLITLCAFSQELTLPEVISTPFPSALTASPDGESFAWVMNDAGVTNIWYLSKPGATPQKLTSYTEDDGRHLDIYSFSPKGDAVYYVKNMRTNPAHDTAGTSPPQIYKIPVTGGEPQHIPTRGAATFSATHDELVWRSGGELHLLPLTEDAESTQLLKMRGTIQRPDFSPNGRQLVFSNNRESNGSEYAFITLYDRDTKSYRYLDPSVYMESSPKFSPDGKKIAWIRQLTDDYEWTLFAATFPLPDPWQLMVHDLETGTTRAVYSSGEKDQKLFTRFDWLDKDHLVFSSEHTGWLQLYATHVGSSKTKALTKGNFEVQTFRVEPDSATVYYQANAGDLDRRHLWKVTLDGTPQQLTSGKGIEWSAVPSKKGHLAWLGSDATRPAGVYVRTSGKKKGKRITGNDFPAHKLRAPEQILLKTSDDWTIHAQLFLPPDSFKGKRPTVMYFHGGPIRQMLLGFHYGHYYHRAYGMNQYLASKGYVVLSVNFRSGIGYGKAFRDVADSGPRGASEYRDLLAGAAFLREHARVDTKRIGLWGGSYGGYMTALGLARNSDLFAAGVDLHGVHDWNMWQAHIENEANDHERDAWKSSAIADLDAWRSPVLLIHGDDDSNVPFGETVWLAKYLREKGVETDLLIFPDDAHSFLLERNWIRTMEATAAFFDKHLAP